MGFFSSKSAPVHYRLIVSLEPNSVGLGLTSVGSNKLEFIDRQYISYGKRPSMKQMQGRLSSLIRNMMHTFVLHHGAKGKIASVLCIHSSAWSIAETHTVDLQFQKPIKVQEKTIIDSIHHHRNESIKSALSNNLELVYHHVQKVRLNGYYTSSPWGNMAQDVSCDLVEGYIDAMMVKFAEDELLRYTHKVTHIPEAFVVMNAAKQIVSGIDEVLIVNIGGETTEIIHADKEHLKRSGSTPSGISSLIRATAEFVHGDEHLAFSHVSMSAKGYRIPTKKEQVALNECVESWRNDFMKGVTAVCGNNVPEHIFFFSATDSMPIAQHMLDPQKISTWSGKKHECVRLFGKKTFQHDFLIAAGALYVVE